MTSVTIDIEDLETLVFNTAALKTIEGALAQRKRDPFIQQHLDFTAAHDRLASAMRNARRAEAGTVVAWDGPLNLDEVLLLRRVEVKGGINITREEKAPEPGEPMSLVDRLAAKGCVVIGQYVIGIAWAGEPLQIKVDADKGFAVKITDRGREKLAKIEAQKAAANA